MLRRGTLMSDDFVSCLYRVLEAVVALQRVIASCRDFLPDPNFGFELEDFREAVEEILDGE